MLMIWTPPIRSACLSRGKNTSPESKLPWGNPLSSWYDLHLFIVCLKSRPKNESPDSEIESKVAGGNPLPFLEVWRYMITCMTHVHDEQCLSGASLHYSMRWMPLKSTLAMGEAPWHRVVAEHPIWAASILNWPSQTSFGRRTVQKPEPQLEVWHVAPSPLNIITQRANQRSMSEENINIPYKFRCSSVSLSGLYF